MGSRTKIFKQAPLPAALIASCNRSLKRLIVEMSERLASEKGLLLRMFEEARDDTCAEYEEARDDIYGVGCKTQVYPLWQHHVTVCDKKPSTVDPIHRPDQG